MPVLPTGVVVFLMTDIEGSTRMWQADASKMSRALSQHDAIVRSAVERHRGALVKAHAAGDSAFAVFGEASAGLAAALDVQRAVGAATWPTPTPLRLRMALHAGEAELRDGDYFGHTVNRCARLRGITHGGQILVSGAIQALVGTAIPAGAGLKPLGRHRLRDLQQPEDVYQLVHAELADDFPPLSSLDAVPNNLPSQLTSFIGRDHDLEALRAILAVKRLLTLTGTGGSGKTRLALHVAAEALADFADGVWLVDLSPLRRPEQVAEEVAGVLGVHESQNEGLKSALASAIGASQRLVILDNCEHLLRASAELASDLLHACPRLHIVATSREALNIRGEVTYAVPPLEYPDPVQTAPLQALAGSESVRLFVDRANLSRQAFVLTERNAAAVAAICARVEGSPLAIELAAAWANVLTPEEIVARLHHHFDLLKRDAVDLPERHQSMRAAFDWSYALLDTPLRTFFDRVAVFAGGFSVVAAQSIAAADGEDALDRLSALVGKSLVGMREGAAGVARFHLLETLRAYAWKQLENSGHLPEIRRRHAEHFVALAETAEAALTGPEQPVWLSRLQEDNDNLREALRWSHETEDVVLGLRLGGALWRFWFMRGLLTEGRSWLETFLALPAEEGTPMRAKALHAAGTLAMLQGDHGMARQLLEQALAVRQSLGDEVGQSQTLTNLGNLWYEQDDYDTARRCYEQSLAIFRRAGSAWNTSLTLHNIANVAYAQGDYAAAHAQAVESLALCRRHGFERLSVNALTVLGLVEGDRGRFDVARQHFEEAVEIVERLGDAPGIAESRRLLGTTLYELGDAIASRMHLQASLALEQQVGNTLGIAKTLVWLSHHARDEDDDDAARAMLLRSTSIATAIGQRQTTSDALEALGLIGGSQGRIAEAVTPLRESLDQRRAMGHALRVVESLESIAFLAMTAGREASALRLAGSAAAARKALGTPLPPSRAKWLVSVIEPARVRMEAEAADAIWGEGERLGLEVATAHAIAACEDMAG